MKRRKLPGESSKAFPPPLRRSTDCQLSPFVYVDTEPSNLKTEALCRFMWLGGSHNSPWRFLLSECIRCVICGCTIFILQCGLEWDWRATRVINDFCVPQTLTGFDVAALCTYEVCGGGGDWISVGFVDLISTFWGPNSELMHKHVDVFAPVLEANVNWSAAHQQEMEIIFYIVQHSPHPVSQLHWHAVFCFFVCVFSIQWPQPMDFTSCYSLLTFFKCLFCYFYVRLPFAVHGKHVSVL